jgi:hypothetical protein
MALLSLMSFLEAQNPGDGFGLQYATAAAAAGLALAAGVAVYSNTMKKRVPAGLKAAPVAPGAQPLLGHLLLVTQPGTEHREGAGATSTMHFSDGHS